MADVFISYASEDRDRVRPLAEALAARGLSVWWDRAQAAGDAYEAVQAQARAVVVVWSHNASASPFVLDETHRAQKTRRLVIVRLDDAELPSGYGAIHTEDFRGWNGAASAPQLEFLASALTARLRPRGPIALPALDTRTRLFAGIGVGVLVVVMAASGIYLATRSGGENEVSEQRVAADRIGLARLLGLVASGQINGDEAAELARMLYRQTFPDASLAVGDLGDSARATFQDAATQLLTDPDPQIRAATIAAAAAETRDDGMTKLWEIANAYGPSSGAIYRYYAAIGSLTGEARTGAALERARDANPSDLRVWRLLSADYAKRDEKKKAEAAALVGEGLIQAASGANENAAHTLEKALPLLDEPSARAFVLGQLGDAAARRDDWAAAERRYAAAVEIHAQTKDLGGAAIDMSKLARAQAQLGDKRKACATLERADMLGVESAATQIKQMCEAPVVVRVPTR